MLDDLKYIHERDAADVLGSAQKQWQQLAYNFAVKQEPVVAKNIVFSGVGSSALVALLSQTWPGYRLPFAIAGDDGLPAYVSAETYFIAVSYSGENEVTIKTTLQAAEQGAHIAIIAGGGKLAAMARERQFPLAVIPDCRQAYYALLYSLKAVVTLLEKAHLLPDKVTSDQLTRLAVSMQSTTEAWLPTVPIKNNRAKQVALDVIGKSIVISAGPKLASAALRWKSGFHEQSKQVAWVELCSELTPHEFMRWADQPVDKPYGIIELRSTFESHYIQKQFEVSRQLLSGLRPAPIVVNALGDTLLEQLLWMIGLGDFTTIYTALANSTDPAPAPLINTFNKLMGDSYNG